MITISLICCDCHLFKCLVKSRMCVFAHRLMQTMEQLSILFDCVRRSDWIEATLFCVDILPRVLAELVPASDVINRVISEFISPGQPHQVC